MIITVAVEPIVSLVKREDHPKGGEREPNAKHCNVKNMNCLEYGDLDQDPPN